MITVNINIASVFAQYENANELKEIAQSVVNQVNEAYKARLAELKQKTAAKQPTVEITTASASTNGKRVAKKEAAKAKQTATKDTKTKAEPKAKKERKPEVSQVAIASLTKAQIKKLGIHFEKYNEKCMLVVGETQSIKDAIKDGGWARWYSRKDDDRQGWMVNNDYAKTIAKELKIKLA
jgi:Skp family chaperone for outer membrane proteins